MSVYPSSFTFSKHHDEFDLRPNEARGERGRARRHTTADESDSEDGRGSCAGVRWRVRGRCDEPVGGVAQRTDLDRRIHCRRTEYEPLARRSCDSYECERLCVVVAEMGAAQLRVRRRIRVVMTVVGGLREGRRVAHPFTGERARRRDAQ